MGVKFWKTFQIKTIYKYAIWGRYILRMILNNNKKYHDSEYSVIACERGIGLHPKTSGQLLNFLVWLMVREF